MKRETFAHVTQTLLALVVILAPLSAFGAEYVPLVEVPYLSDAAGTNDLAAYFNKLYLIAIAVGALIAFIKIVMAGVKWSFSDIITNKSEARADITNSLLGLVILLIPFIILNTIYPNLTNLNILRNSTPLDVSKSTSAPSNNSQQVSGGNLVWYIQPVNKYLPPADQASQKRYAETSCTVRGGTLSITDVPNTVNGITTVIPTYTCTSPAPK